MASFEHSLILKIQKNQAGTDAGGPANGVYAMKRAVDVVFSMGMLLAMLPVMLAAALAVGLTSPGPILFRQRRVGRGFREFTIFKFRTMSADREGPAITFGADPRITRVGRLLRALKLDELPQLWNVLRGEMSLVGPRPVVPWVVEKFGAEYGELLVHRPGLTDPASLKYCQETGLLERARDPKEFFWAVVTPDKLRMSIAYLKRATVWSDLRVLGMTALICCMPRFQRVYGELPDAAWTAGPDWRGEIAMPVWAPVRVTAGTQGWTPGYAQSLAFMSSKLTGIGQGIGLESSQVMVQGQELSGRLISGVAGPAPRLGFGRGNGSGVWASSRRAGGVGQEGLGRGLADRAGGEGDGAVFSHGEAVLEFGAETRGRNGEGMWIPLPGAQEAGKPAQELMA